MKSITDEKTSFAHDRYDRKLQFENMFDTSIQSGRGSKKRNNNKKTGSVGSSHKTKNQQLTKAVDDIILEADRYHLWWTGPPPENEYFTPASWGSSHNSSSHAIFTMAVIHGQDDKMTCSSPNNLLLYIGSLRRVYDGDIVIAIESEELNENIKRILAYYKVIVYVLPQNLCSKATSSIFCGSQDERVPASVFRYYFFEKWAILYKSTSMLIITDFRDVIFQQNPFKYHTSGWFPEAQLAVFQEFHPNMIINRCRFNKRIMAECYGENSLKTFGNRIIISSGAMIGSRDAMVVWSRQMTMQLQDAPGRMVETRCLSGGIEHSFINYLVYGNKLRQVMRIRIFPHGEGVVNSLGGLNPNTVVGNITGSLKYFKVLDENGYILNWNGEVSPVVHQLDHFLEELEEITDEILSNKLNFSSTIIAKSLLSGLNVPLKSSFLHDRGWQSLASSQCLWDCKNSFNYNMTN
eukprot:gene9066-12228_t